MRSSGRRKFRVRVAVGLAASRSGRCWSCLWVRLQPDSAMRERQARAVVEATFRREHGRIIAALIRLCGSFDRAEEAMQDAFASALAHWSEQGIPDNPAAWITAASHRKLIDVARRERTRREKRE